MLNYVDKTTVDTLIWDHADLKPYYWCDLISENWWEHFYTSNNSAIIELRKRLFASAPCAGMALVRPSTAICSKSCFKVLCCPRLFREKMQLYDKWFGYTDKWLGYTDYLFKPNNKWRGNLFGGYANSNPARLLLFTLYAACSYVFRTKSVWIRVWIVWNAKVIKKLTAQNVVLSKNKCLKLTALSPPPSSGRSEKSRFSAYFWEEFKAIDCNPIVS